MDVVLTSFWNSHGRSVTFILDGRRSDVVSVGEVLCSTESYFVVVRLFLVRSSTLLYGVVLDGRRSDVVLEVAPSECYLVVLCSTGWSFCST